MRDGVEDEEDDLGGSDKGPAHGRARTRPRAGDATLRADSSDSARRSSAKMCFVLLRATTTLSPCHDRPASARFLYTLD